MIIKLIGVYFAYSTVVAVPEVISSVYSYTSLPSPPRFAKNENPAANTQTVSPGFPGNPTINNPTNPAIPKAETDTPAEKAKNEALKLFLWNLFATIFYGLIGWYLIRDGRFLFAILNHEEASADASSESGNADSSFPLSKKKEKEVVTSLNLSGGAKEEITSLNLSDFSNEQTAQQPFVSSDSPADAPNDAPLEELNITPSDEQK